MNPFPDSKEVFLQTYWLKEELVRFCRQFGLSRTGTKSEIGDQFEYNRYTRDFFAANPTMTRQKCIVCWKYKKQKLGSHRYESSDLEALRSS